MVYPILFYSSLFYSILLYYIRTASAQTREPAAAPGAPPAEGEHEAPEPAPPPGELAGTLAALASCGQALRGQMEELLCRQASLEGALASTLRGLRAGGRSRRRALGRASLATEESPAGTESAASARPESERRSSTASFVSMRATPVEGEQQPSTRWRRGKRPKGRPSGTAAV